MSADLTLELRHAATLEDVRHLVSLADELGVPVTAAVAVTGLNSTISVTAPLDTIGCVS